MKNRFLIILFSTFFFQSVLAENLNIQSTSISIDKNTRITIFKDDVIASDSKNNIFKRNPVKLNVLKMWKKSNFSMDEKIMNKKSKTFFDAQNYFKIVLKLF